LNAPWPERALAQGGPKPEKAKWWPDLLYPNTQSAFDRCLIQVEACWLASARIRAVKSFRSFRVSIRFPSCPYGIRHPWSRPSTDV